MNPAQAEQALKEKIIRYLDRTLPVKGNMPEAMRKKFECFQNAKGKGGMDFVRSPYLEVTQVYQSSALSLQDLVEKKLLEQEVADAFASYFGGTTSAIHPYEHQCRSLEAVDGNEKKNLVVCTGTGSGKTECFLLPVINALYRQHKKMQEEGVPYKPHIRAMLLYPMNALVNDQLNRLRRILKHLPCITFGRYTRETDYERTPLFIEDNQVRKLNDEWARLPLYKTGISEENALTNEYLDRARWEEEGGADILVTNFAMLERLMLVPDNNFFDECWDFIILDEAHSYTGSTGTEIAWLMRRLERRLRDEKHGPIQFLATSATLSSNPNEEEQKQAAEEFARKIFPLSGRPLHVEFGTKCKHLDETGAVPIPEANLATFAESTEELHKKTIDLELRKVRLKANERNIDLLKAIDDEGRLPAKFLFDLSWLFDFPNRQTTDLPQDIKVDDSIRFLANLVLSKSDDRDDWRDFLHDESLPGGTSLPGDLDDENNPQVKGNRLHILPIWKSIVAPEDGPASIDFDTFYYLYWAANDIVQNNDAINYAIPRLMVQITETRRQLFADELARDEKERQDVAESTQELSNEWRSVLPIKEQGLDYGTLLYRSLVTHPEIQTYMRLTADKPKAFDTLAREVGNGENCEEDLRQMLELGALAVNPATRRPLVEVRYHQVIRQVSDIGIYFEEGDSNRPVFVRNQDEYGPHGEKVFTLGACRFCGHPYLLGYSDELGRISTVTRVLRAKTKANGYMYAFSWLGEEVELPEKLKKKKSVDLNVYLNLKTGEVSSGKKAGNGWIQTKAMLRPKGRGVEQSFIPQCSACWNEQNRSGLYGIITPYEAVGEYYRLAVLNAFAEFSDGDADPQKKGRVPADGRKVLVFTDSRPNAARLAHAFERLVETRLTDRLILELVQEYRSFNTPENRRKRDNLKATIDNCDLPNDVIDAMEDSLARLDLRMEEGNSTMDTLLFSPTEEERKIKLKQRRGLLYEKLAGPDVQYTQLLDYEDKDKVLVRNLLLISKFRILQALRNGTRNNLLGKNLLTVTSRAMEKCPAAEWAKLGQRLGVDGSIAKEIARLVYVHLIRHVRVGFDSESDEAKLSEGDDKLDQWTKGTITCTSFCSNRANNPVFRISKEILVGHQQPVDSIVLSNWLLDLWRKLKDDIKLLRLSNQKSKDEDEYALNFGMLCGDIRLNLGRNRNDEDERNVLPLVIQEHTAQIDAKMGAIYQRLFTDGKVNILSCSTTFEMGVDVGGLNNVFLANLPPASANYRQRAGRAGRRPGAAAYILSLAGDSLHDQNFYEHVEELFWGEIQPPEIYLQQPIYAARHFRAEGLHDFFAYLQALGEQGQEIASQWAKISYFILGQRVTYSLDENRHPKDYKAIPLADTCCSRYLAEWGKARGTTMDGYLASMDGFGALQFGRPYSVAEDIVFQLGYSPLPRDEQTATYQYYRNLGGCRVPEWNDDIKQMKEGRSSKRWGLKQRIETRFAQLAQQSDGDEATPAQVHLMNEQTIEILSETCILPRYGFPTDIIELIPSKNEKKTFARGVKMQRRLEKGLFEYAPGQTVVCNKRCFKSWRPAISAWPGAEGYSATLAGEMSENTLYCQVCKKVYDKDDEHKANSLCPVCGLGTLRKKDYITPEAFFAFKSFKGKLSPQKQAHRVVHWGGKLIGAQTVPGWKITTGESSDRMLQYINPGPEDEGFQLSFRDEVGDDKPDKAYYFVHEVQTNIAIWQMGGGQALRSCWENDEKRVEKAYLSALYALRRSIAKELSIDSRDLGCLLKRNLETGNYDFVFFDKAAGGGGWALALTMQSREDETTARRIQKVLEDAIQSLHNCNCKCEMDVENPSQLTADEQKRKPVTLPEFKSKNLNEQPRFRPVVACYCCLKDYDNQSEQTELDRWDALTVLELQREGATAGDEDERWEPFREPLEDGWMYRLKNGEEKRYNRVEKNFDAEDVAMQEKDY